MEIHFYYLIKKLKGFLFSENDCYVVYAVRIHTPKPFSTITDNDLQFVLRHITRADVKGGSLKGDKRTIRDYITLNGKGAGVFLNTSDSKIEYQEKGTDPLYGIAVGFAKESELAKLAKKLFGDHPAKIQEGQSFIYIAPYEKVGSLCKVI